MACPIIKPPLPCIQQHSIDDDNVHVPLGHRLSESNFECKGGEECDSVVNDGSHSCGGAAVEWRRVPRCAVLLSDDGRQQQQQPQPLASSAVCGAR